jgi:hypothetical protein
MTQSCEHLCTYSRPLCHSGESTPHHPSLHCYCCCGPLLPAITPPQQVRLKLLDSQVPLARSQKAPPPEMRAVVSRVVAPATVAHPEVPANQWADDRCSCMRCGEDKPSNI